MLRKQEEPGFIIRPCKKETIRPFLAIKGAKGKLPKLDN